MTTINTVPKPLSFREKMSAIWSILRNRRWRSAHRSDTRTLYTFQPYVAEVAFKWGYTFRFQWYGKPEYATVRALVINCREYMKDSPDELDLISVDTLVSARLIRRRDLAVFHIAGKEYS